MARPVIGCGAVRPPIFVSTREIVISLLVFDTLLAVVLSLLSGTPLWINLVYSHLIGGSITLLEELLRRTFWAECGWPPLSKFVLMMVTVIPLGTLAGASLANWLTGIPPDLRLFAHASLMTHQLVVLGIAIIASSLISLWLWQRARLAEARLHAEQAQRGQTLAELRLLQAQIEPHFLFNTLAHLDALLSPAELAQAQQLLDHLTRYLRGALSATRREHACVADEIALIEPYLEILRVRFGPRLRWQLDISPAAAACPLPPMLLQPLVENAVRHGIEPCVAGGCIAIRADSDGRTLTLSVRDNGAGLHAPCSHPGGGAGLANLRARLQALYGAAASLELHALSPHGTCAQLTLPALAATAHDATLPDC